MKGARTLLRKISQTHRKLRQKTTPSDELMSYCVKIPHFDIYSSLSELFPQDTQQHHARTNSRDHGSALSVLILRLEVVIGFLCPAAAA
jgi:hypothetical protein